MFQLWFYHYSFLKSTGAIGHHDDNNYYFHVSYSEMLIGVCFQLPYLLKGHRMTLLLLLLLLLLLILLLLLLFITVCYPFQSSSLLSLLSSLQILEVVFFFYILYRASVINSLHDKITELSTENFWEEMTSSTSTSSSNLKQLIVYMKIEGETYSIFKLGQIEVRRGRLIATIVGFLSYCLYVVVIVESKIQDEG